MKKLRTERVQLRVLAVGMVILSVMLLAPLFAIAHYSVKSADDFGYFKDPEALWQSTHSLFTMIKAQAAYAVYYWKTWQGTYFSEWLITIVMGICGDKYYFVGAYLAIGGLVLSELLLFKIIFMDMLSAEWDRTLVLSLSCILMQILLMPAPCEAFYWFCGAGLYTWIYALAVLLLALVLHTVLRNPAKGRVLREAGILFLAFAVGGSNFVISILMLVIFGGGLIILWLYRHRLRVLMTVNFLFYLCCMILAVCSPGNQKRVVVAGSAGYPFVESIFRSLKEALFYLCSGITLPYVLVGLMMAPLMTGLVKKKKYRYPLPVLITAVTFGMFASQFAPNLYSIGIIGAGRVQNLYRMTMSIWLYGNELYWIGWLYQRYACKEEESAADAKASENSWLLPGWCAGMIILAASLCVWGGQYGDIRQRFFVPAQGRGTTV